LTGPTRAVLIHNPAAGLRHLGDPLGDIRSVLRQGGVEVELAPTSGPGDATEIAADTARRESADWVLVFGGDGTLREAAKGLLGSPVALAPLSAGTTNVVTRALGLPTDPRRAAKSLLGAAPRDCDVGLCGDEPFLMQASLGIDAAVMAEVSAQFKKVAGRAAVALSGLKTWWTYDYPALTYEADGERGNAAFIAACNIEHYGGDFRVAPGANFFNGRLDLVTLEAADRLTTLQFALQLLTGSHLEMPGVSFRPVQELLLPGPLPAPLQLDGDHKALEPPLRIRLADQTVRLLVPDSTNR
jgi:diacylglycerol kinase family enzyme